MKKILLIGTGGTIASEETGDGLAPEIPASGLLSRLTGVERGIRVESAELLALDSTNITPEHWLMIAGCIKTNYAGYDGFVITHGTDTLAYTAAALSYLVKGSPKPIVLTGAQRPIGVDSTDSRENLRDALLCATSDMPGVSIVFDHKIILGTRAKKTRSKSFSAFESINYPDLGVIRDGAVLPFIRQECGAEPEFSDALDTKVALLKLIPGVKRDVLDFLFERNDAVVIESFGVGGLPETGGFFESVRAWKERGRIAVLTTQVENEGSDLTVYHVGNRLKRELGVLEAYDMTTEAVIAKLMWILAKTKKPTEVERLFYTPVGMDMFPR